MKSPCRRQSAPVFSGCCIRNPNIADSRSAPRLSGPATFSILASIFFAPLFPEFRLVVYGRAKPARRIQTKQPAQRAKYGKERPMKRMNMQTIKTLPLLAAVTAMTLLAGNPAFAGGEGNPQILPPGFSAVYSE